MRRDICVTLRFEMTRMSQRTSAECASLKIPHTISVKNNENTSTPKLLGPPVLVLEILAIFNTNRSVTTARRRRIGLVPSRRFSFQERCSLPLRKSDDRRICRSFTFHCYPRHYNNDDSQYRYVIRLRYSSHSHSHSLAWRCSYVNKNHKTLLLFSIVSRILSTLLRSRPETNHHLDGTLAEK